MNKVLNADSFQGQISAQNVKFKCLTGQYASRYQTRWTLQLFQHQQQQPYDTLKVRGKKLLKNLKVLIQFVRVKEHANTDLS